VADVAEFNRITTHHGQPLMPNGVIMQWQLRRQVEIRTDGVIVCGVTGVILIARLRKERFGGWTIKLTN
jgi:hypothetical protein